MTASAPRIASPTDGAIIGSDPARVHAVAARPTVSGVHCRITRADGTCFIEDLGSRNGTWIAERRLVPGEKVAIAPGGTFSLGRETAYALDARLLAILDEPSHWTRPVLLDVPIDPPRPPSRPSPPVSSVAPLEALSTFPEGQAIAMPARPGAPSLSIGYAPTNDVCVPIAVVSGRHARLSLDGERFVIEDQGSTNGVFVGGRRVTVAELRPGDAFALGSHRMVLDNVLVERLRDRVAQRPDGRVTAPSQRFSLGRDPANDVVLDAPMVSSFHAFIEPLTEGGYLVIDRGSTNGTFLNSRENRVSTGTAGLDDILYLGSYRLPVARLPELLEGRAAAQARGPLRTVVVGRDAGVDVQIDRPQVSRRHAELRALGGGRFELRDLGSSNGTFVNGKRLRAPAVVTADDRVSLGSVRLVIDSELGVVAKDYHGDIVLQAERISVDVPDATAPGGTRRILNDVSFSAYPTEFVGLLGPSGAGKTTLMMALNGYLRPLSGRSVLNGLDLYDNYESFRGNIGYVPQDDIVYPQLTVYESLYYTARLRLPSDTSHDEIDGKISSILDKLEIAQARDVIIGDALKKGISGGQRKRVNLAQELITEPSLLFLDEPTSGLASEDALNVMTLLRTLADGGKTILMTIHQPSLEAYRLMDNVLYLFQGGLVYYGPAYPDSITFFNDEPRDDTERDKLLADPGNALKPLSRERRKAMDGDPSGREARLRAVVENRRHLYLKSRYYREFVYDRAGQRFADAVQIEPSRKRTATGGGTWRQLAILVARTARIKWKDRVNTLILLAQAPIIATVLSLVFAGEVGTNYFETIARGPAALFLLVASAVWFGCSNSAREIVSEQAIFRRERMVNLMIPSYVLSKAAVLGAVSALQCLVLLAMVYFPLQLDGNFAAMFGVLTLSSWAGLGMGLTLSALVRSSEAAMTLVPLLLIPQIILGGVIMPVYEMNTPMRVLSSTMTARWGFEGLLHLEYGDDELPAIREQCEIPACVWTIGPRGYTYLPGDPAAASSEESTGGVQALAGGIIPYVEPLDEAVCHGFCAAARTSGPISPLDRSFGVDPADEVRLKARQDVLVDAAAPDQYTAPAPNARTSARDVFAFLGLSVAFLLALVMAILRYRDVDVD
jgi:ABC-type multidrug transport system ATPase subunit/predicted component of type VI protein secretion system